MDPLTGAVIAIVFWFIVITPGYLLALALCTLVGKLIADNEGIVIGGIIGIVVGIVWGLFAIVMLILEIVNVLQLVAG